MRILVPHRKGETFGVIINILLKTDNIEQYISITQNVWTKTGLSSQLSKASNVVVEAVWCERRDFPQNYQKCHWHFFPIAAPLGAVLGVLFQVPSLYCTKKSQHPNGCWLFLVRETGLEPVRVAPHAPQTCASADSATLASTK